MNYGNATLLSLLAFQDQVDALEEQVVQLFGRESKHHGVVRDLHNMISMAGTLNQAASTNPATDPPSTPRQAGQYWKLIRDLKKWQPRKEWLAKEIKQKMQS